VNSDNPTSFDSLYVGTDFILQVTAYGQYTLGQGVLNYWVQDPNMITHNVPTAGVVVSRVRTYDPIANNTSVKKYYYASIGDPTGLSSGTTMFKPAYLSDYIVKSLCYGPNSQGSPVVVDPCGTLLYYKTLSSNSLVNLYGFSQYHIYFSSVLESFGDNFDNGGIEHGFLIWPDFQAETIMGSDLLDCPVSNNGVALNGLESYTNYFTRRNGALSPVKQIIKNYRQDSRLFGLAYGYTIRRKYATFCSGGATPLPGEFDPFDVKRNYIYAEWAYADTVDTREFDVNGVNTMTTRVIYNYDNLKGLSPTRIVTFNSKGDTLITLNKYPNDIDKATVTAEAGAAIDSLISKHILNPVLSKEEYKNSTFLRRLSTYYKNWPNNIPAPRSVEFKLSTNPAESRIQFDNYDAYGNILDQYKVNDQHMSYIWDYRNEFPVAEAKNAQTNDIAYTSFEADGTGGVYLNNSAGIVATDGITGNKCYAIDNVLARFNLDPSKTYVVSLWAKNGTPRNNGFNGSTQVVADNTNWTTGKTIRGWTYLEKRFTGVTTINVGGGGGLVDEVRFYPANALMTTYTYAPSIGITSETDARGITTYYEYDGFMRLARIRDSDGNIIKTYDYHYQGQ
jgi:YD repeat-containing protein